MTNPQAIRAARDGKKGVVEKLWDRQVVNEPFPTTDPELASKLRVPKQDVRNARVELEALGCIKTERKQTSGGKGNVAWHTIWTLLVPRGTAIAKMESKWRVDDEHTATLMANKNPAKGRRTNGADPAPATMNGHATHAPEITPSIVVSMSGPDPVRPLASLSGERKDEPRALLEAARQYAETHRALESKVKELEALGVTVDHAQLAKAIKAPHDHQLLAVSKVLPYVEGIERQLQRALDANHDLREKASRVQEFIDKDRRQTEQIKRLVAENTSLRDQLHGKVTATPAPVPNAPARAG